MGKNREREIYFILFYFNLYLYLQRLLFLDLLPALSFSFSFNLRELIIFYCKDFLSSYAGNISIEGYFFGGDSSFECSVKPEFSSLKKPIIYVC